MSVQFSDRANAMEQSSDHAAVSGCSSTLSVHIAPNMGRHAWGMPPGFNAYHVSTDASLFSSSLPVLHCEKLNFTVPEHENSSADDDFSKLDKLTKDIDSKESIGELDFSGIGMLPDDEEELLAGIADDFDSSRLCNEVDVEDCDIFGSGGGMELDCDHSGGLAADVAKTNINNGYSGSGSVQYNIPNGAAAIATEHPYGEHPSRTLFVRNINSNVEDSELRSLFEQYGDIRTLYTACKHRGFVMISYYDIRHARTAMRALQNKPVRRRKLDIHFSIPKENPPEKDINQGTLVIFNLDESVTHDELRQIFGAYGEVKEIRETPNKRHHKFIEFYDVRAAEDALRSLNRSDIAGKRVKLEPSRPGGARRNLIQQSSQDLEHDETRCYRQQVGSPITSSPGSWAQFSSPSNNSPLRALSQSPTFSRGIPMVNNHIPGLASVLPSLLSNSLKISSNSHHGVPSQHSHSFPESGVMPYMSSKSGKPSFNPSTSRTSGIGTVTGSQFHWGNPISYSEPRTSAWPTSSMRNSPYSSYQGSLMASPHHHVGSAPSGVPFERHFALPESSFMSQVGLGSRQFGSNEQNLLMNMRSGGQHINSGVSFSGNMPENTSSGLKMSPRLGNISLGSPPVSSSTSTGVEGLFERVRACRVVNNGSQLDCKKQFELNLEKIISGEDTRTTLMLKNIPNKYTSKMLVAAIDENHKSTYDLLFLPIDFKNKCNVGYAFINVVSPSHIIPFYQDFNGKKWEKFNSEKVASLAYARIQGKEALFAHFQNSSSMNDDTLSRPNLFVSQGHEAFDQELFASNGCNIYVYQQDGSLAGDSAETLPKTNSNEKPDKSVTPGSSSRER